MAVNTVNGTGTPGVKLGFTAVFPPLQAEGAQSGAYSLIPLMNPSQVIGFVPLYPCCPSKEVGGSYGCAQFTITMSGNCTNGNLQITFVTPDGKRQLFNFIVPTDSWTCHDLAEQIFNYIQTFNEIPPFTASLVGDPTTSCTVQICPPNNPAYYGTFISLNVIQGNGGGTIGVVGLTPPTPLKINMGTLPTITYDIAGCGDCRQGQYFGDSIPDDKNFTLPVFGNLSSTDTLTNDFNTWLLLYPNGYDAIAKGDFTLQQLQANGAWTIKATLNNSTLGRPFNNNLGTTKWPFYQAVNASVFSNPLATCTTQNYQGFQLNWRSVLLKYGPGTYRFCVNGQLYGALGQGPAYCMCSTPFCLMAWDCHKADATLKFRAQYVGGTFGDVNIQGNSWSLCCPGIPANGTNPPTPGVPMAWQDSIRYLAFFGPPSYDYEVKDIKYQTGEKKKIRDEALKKFIMKTDQLPQWLIDRFASYGLMADQLFVSDYNYNNPSYNIKDLWVIRDSSVNPKYKQESRYTKILDLQFKEGKQYIFRDRCC